MRYAEGFILDTPLTSVGLKYYPVAASTTIAKGDAVKDNGSGYLTLATDGIGAAFLGIAHSAADNGSGAVGAINCAVIPPMPNLSFWVKNESATVAAQTDVGEIIDLDSEDGVDVTDVTTSVWGFIVDEIDISAKALAYAAGGFVKGRFQQV